MKMKIVSLSNHKGSALLFTVIAITSIAVLGTGIYFMTSTSTFSGISANDQNRAYQLAVAGKEYALANNADATYNRDYTFSNGDKFRLVINGDEIKSTGIVKEGTPYEAKRTITATVTGFSSRPDISFAKDIADFAPGVKETQTGFVDVGQPEAKISIGQFTQSQFGSVWYSGNTGVAQGNCQEGKCDFGKGFRIYFVFKLERFGSEIPHGFTFTIFNGAENSNTSAGGDIGMPELIAYGGNSCKTGSGSNCTSWLVNEPYRGIHPPKMGIEFDGRQNTGFPDFCPPQDRVDSQSREDGNRTHMAMVFWGDNTSFCPNRGNSMTYEDNRHGTGDTSSPINAVSTDVSDTNDYFTGLTRTWSPDWLYNTGNVYALRIETTRPSEMTGGKYVYSVKTWIKRCSGTNINDTTACIKDQNNNDINADFSNTKKAYKPDPEDPPTLQRTDTTANKIELDPTFHEKFNKFLYGWTAAAGSASREKLTLKNFQLYFIRN